MIYRYSNSWLNVLVKPNYNNIKWEYDVYEPDYENIIRRRRGEIDEESCRDDLIENKKPKIIITESQLKMIHESLK